MAESCLNYYVLVTDYEQGLTLHELLTDNGIDNRIAPTPRAVQGRLSCGMSLLIKPEDLESVRDCFDKIRQSITISFLTNVK